jgi:hypothetical protein
MKLRLLMLAGVLASFCIVGPIAETSAGPGYTTVTTIRATNPVFHGRVHLRKASQHPKVARPCRTHRRVVLFRHHQHTTNRIGQDRTNRLGHWTIATHPHEGRYFALAKRRILPNRGNKVCERDTSRRIRIG